MMTNDNSPILIDQYLAQLSSEERLYPTTDGNRCRDKQPNISQSSGNPIEGEEGLKEPEVSRTPQENP